MKVYLVIGYPHYEMTIMGIYSTREKAQEAIDAINKKFYTGYTPEISEEEVI